MPMTPTQGRWLYNIGRGTSAVARGGVKTGRWLLTTPRGRNVSFFVLGAYVGHKIQRGIQKLAAHYVLPGYGQPTGQPRIRFMTTSKI